MPSFLSYNDEPKGGVHNLMDFVPRRGEWFVAPLVCPTGEVGLPGTQRAGTPSGPNNCTPISTFNIVFNNPTPAVAGSWSTTGDIIPASFWKPVVDYYLDHEYNRDLTPISWAAKIHDGAQLYYLANNVDPYVQAWLAFTDETYLTTAVDIIEAQMALTKPSNTLESYNPDSLIWNDTYQSWDAFTNSQGFTRAGGQVIQNEAQFAKHVLYMCAKALDAASGVTAGLVTRIEAIRSWFEINMLEKWYVRGVGGQVPDIGHIPLNTIDHQDGYARWASICVALESMHNNGTPGRGQLTNPANLGRIRNLGQRAGVGYIEGDPVTDPLDQYDGLGGTDTNGVRWSLIDHPTAGADYWWFNRFFQPAPITAVSPGDDLSHGNMVTRYIADAVELGVHGPGQLDTQYELPAQSWTGWTSADLDKWRNTFVEVLWNQDVNDFKHSTYIDGAGQTANLWLQDGWFALGRTSADFQRIIQTKPAWVGTYAAEHYAALARNAHDLGFD